MSAIATMKSRVVRTSNVCGGDARIDDTRIPVWLLIRYRQMGTSDERLLEFYPHLSTDDLAACWEYYRHHANEVERTIWLSDAAMNVVEGTDPPACALVRLFTTLPYEALEPSQQLFVSRSAEPAGAMKNSRPGPT